MPNPISSHRTAAEKSFAKALKLRKINFLHNIMLEGYEVDFYLPVYNVVIEIDGYFHLGSDKQNADSRKERALNQRGITLFRVTNQQIRTDLSACIDPIETYLKNFQLVTESRSINTEWKDPLREYHPPKPPAPPKKFRTVEEYFLSLDDE